jgi:hypothetical protein
VFLPSRIKRRVLLSPLFNDAFNIETIERRMEIDGRGVGVRVPVGLKMFSSLQRPDRLWGISYPMGTEGPSYPIGTGAFSPGKAARA